jgi:hypothetical protein
VLFDPARHEPLADRPWDEARVRAAIATIVADTEGAFDERELWLAHPRDLEDGPLPQATSAFLGAAGVIWALHELERRGAAELQRDWTPIALGLADRYLAAPDFQDEVDGSIASLYMGEAGVLLTAHTMAPAAWQEERLLAAVEANVDHPSRELMWGAPGTMIAARVLHERTGAERWRDAWRASAEHMWAEWSPDGLWEQNLPGTSGPAHYIGPIHGFAGNVLALAQGNLLDPTRRDELEQRAVATLAELAQREERLWQWPPALEPPRTPQGARTQWCHGAAGIAASFGSFAPDNDELSEMLLGAGELTWLAGPLKTAQLCHGTAGNGYAFLKLFERTGDELWLDRARRFAMHSTEQVERAWVEDGRGRHALFSGDPGTAVYLLDCLDATSAFPFVDRI